MRRCLALLTLVSTFAPAIGCQYEEFDDFARRASHLTCTRMRHCEPTNYDERFGLMGHDECRDEVEDQWQAKHDQFDDLRCDYDPEVGRRCLGRMGKMKKSCDFDDTLDIEESCRLVFDCFAD
jgi:hypothetical protein